MGYESENASFIVFDIETASLEDAVDYLESVETPANYKDPVKIAAYLVEKQADQLAKCALDVDLCRVVAIGWQEEGRVPNAVVLKDADQEAEALRDLWERFGHHPLVGFNCLAFDLPVLLRRSLYLGVPAPKIQIDRFRHARVTDLLSELSYDGKLRLRSLAFYAKRFGLKTEETIPSATIPQAVAEGRWEDISAHVLDDVRVTAQLAQRLGLFRGPSATSEDEIKAIRSLHLKEGV